MAGEKTMTEISHLSIKSKKISRVVSIRYFRSVFGRYFSGITNTIRTEEKLGRVGTFRHQKGGSAPLFPQKGGNGPLFEDSSSKSDTSKIPIPKKLLVTPWYTTLKISHI